MSESETEWRLVLRPPHVPSVPCLRSCTCHLWRVVEGRAGEEGGTPGADGADGADGEAPAVLLHAARRVGAVLRRYRERLAAQSEALTRTFHEAESAVQELERFAMRGALGQARRHDQAVQRRHTEDGAEDRRRRPRWLRWLP